MQAPSLPALPSPPKTGTLIGQMFLFSPREMINWWNAPIMLHWEKNGLVHERVSEGVGSGRESKRHERAHKSAIWPRATRNTLRYFRHFTNKTDREAFAAQFVCESERRAGPTKASRKSVCVSESECAVVRIKPAVQVRVLRRREFSNSPPGAGAERRFVCCSRRVSSVPRQKSAWKHF